MAAATTAILPTVAGLLALLLLLLLPVSTSADSDDPTSFSFTYNFTASDDSTAPDGIQFQGDAFFNKFIRLTLDSSEGPLTSSTGRVYYSSPLPLVDPVTGKLASFSTRFAFSIYASNPAFSGDGLAFFLSPFPSSLPNNSAGGFLALYNTTAGDNQTVAAEFDTYQDDWDPSGDHVGIDLGNIRSAVTTNWPSSMKDGRRAYARVTYDGDAKNLSVFLSYNDSTYHSSISYIVDLSQFLPKKVAVGFAASTGAGAELHQIHYWDFNTSISPQKQYYFFTIVGLSVLLVLLVIGGIVWFVVQWRRTEEELEHYDEGLAYEQLADEFSKDSGPRQFRYRELMRATKNFSEDLKLGQGGFGAVYRGHLKDLNLDVAIKRMSKGSSQGRKEYAAEVRVISQLRHRNLVKLVGWCHEHRGDFLLVYELMHKGSVDTHFYGKGDPLDWPKRYEVAISLASALCYLHEECPKVVLHRDIKLANVMLDASGTAKLGDFGLAKLVDHGVGSQTTVIAGTLGYMAPEYAATAKPSKETDVYSFGVVCLEIATGRRPVEFREEPSKILLVPWVWNLYGKGRIFEAVDPKLEGKYDASEMEALLLVGLWCAHPDDESRPSIQQALSTLKFEANLPQLPAKMPKAMFTPSPLADIGISLTVGGGSASTSTVGAAGESAFLDSAPITTADSPLLDPR